LTEDVIRQILNIEKQAQAVYNDAQREAARIVAQAETEADRILRQTEEQAREEAQRLLDDARAEAEEKRGRILDGTCEELRQIEEEAESHLDEAVHYVVDQVVGRE